jgi:molybdopterin synthase sulfur carrier subunit
VHDVESRTLSIVPTVSFTANLQRHVDCPDRAVAAETVREALEVVFAQTPRLREYVLDDNGAVRRHVNIFVDGRVIDDRRHQSDRVSVESSIYVMQAISGG